MMTRTIWIIAGFLITLILFGMGYGIWFLKQSSQPVAVDRFEDEAVTQGSESNQGEVESDTQPEAETVLIMEEDSPVEEVVAPLVPLAADEVAPREDAVVDDTQGATYKSFDFVAIGDSEHSKDPLGFDLETLRVYDKVRSLAPDFALFTGDIIMANADPAGPRASVTNAVKIIDEYFPTMPTYITFGWHDVECGVRCVDYWNAFKFGNPYVPGEARSLDFAFSHENARFILVSTDFPKKRTLTNKQLEWLEEELKKTTKEHVIIGMHVPPVTFFEDSAEDCHDFACQPELQARLAALFERYNVDLVIAGHESVFDHKIVGKTHYVLSGNSSNTKNIPKGAAKGQNFTHFFVDGSSLKVQGRNVDGTVIREIKIR